MENKTLALFVCIIIITSALSITIGQSFKENIIPVVEAQADVSYGTAPLIISFSCFHNDQDGDIKKVLWDFGDGSESDKEMIRHTYSKQGTFFATITVWDNAGAKSSDTIEIDVVNYQKPIASITTNKTVGKSPLLINFSGNAYDLERKISSYHWDFGDGSTSDIQNPIHWFNETGSYYVWLTVSFDNRIEVTTSIEINVIEKYIPHAILTSSSISGKAPKKINFYGDCLDSDNGNHSYHWFFDDGFLPKNKESTEQNPSHIFWIPGIYQVSLNVTDEDGNSDIETITIHIHESKFSDFMSNVTKYALNRFFNNIVKLIIERSISNIFGNIFSFRN
ncbi:MAG: hypothetical protein DRN27_07545 [Thermoplasmata archaeon]|nr:MAG: hypothetical protein DRN27_07545 [Thermoplasmata archaeon]